jgi:hypothetical protein
MANDSKFFLTLEEISIWTDGFVFDIESNPAHYGHEPQTGVYDH